MKASTGFALGIVAGCAGLLLAQSLTRENEPVEQIAPAESRRLSAQPVGEKLAAALEKITTLEAEVVAAGGRGSISAGVDADAEAVSDGGGADKAASVIEMMMAFGEKGGKREIEKEVLRLSGILGLTENQQAVVREALDQKASEKKAAGILLFTGGATVADLMASDEHNFSGFDKAIEAVLDAEQLEAYEGVREEREVKRIETKTDQEIRDLAAAADLDEEQQDAAWKVLADINASEKPGDIPEGTSNEDFIDILDGALTDRIDRLTPILNDEQLDIYKDQIQDFRKMVGAFVGQAEG